MLAVGLVLQVLRGSGPWGCSTFYRIVVSREWGEEQSDADRLTFEEKRGQLVGRDPGRGPQRKAQSDGSPCSGGGRDRTASVFCPRRLRADRARLSVRPRALRSRGDAARAARSAQRERRAPHAR